MKEDKEEFDSRLTVCSPHVVVLRASIVYDLDDGLVCPGVAAGRQRRQTGEVPVVPARVLEAAQARERAQGRGGRRVSPRKVQGAVSHPREQHLLLAQSQQAAAVVAQGALHRGRKNERTAPGCSRLVCSFITCRFFLSFPRTNTLTPDFMNFSFKNLLETNFQLIK